MKAIVIATVLVATVSAAPAWAQAQDRTDAGAVAAAPTAPGAAPTDLDLQLKLGLDSFRLAARLFGPNGVAGAWLNGDIGPNGFELDARVQRGDGRAWNFTLDTEMVDEVDRLAWRWLRERALPLGDRERTL